MARRTLTALGHASVAFAAALLAGLLIAARSQATELELAGESLVTVTSDSQTRGGGPGLGVELGVVVLRDLLQKGSCVLVRERSSAMIGMGLVWGLEVGSAWRARSYHSWTPELGIEAMTLGGALIRSIDTRGHVAGNPVALGLAITPLRFQLQEGWVSLLAARGGPTLLRDGSPPFMVSVTLFEVGRTLQW
jgi:hypothetical protein